MLLDTTTSHKELASMKPQRCSSFDEMENYRCSRTNPVNGVGGGRRFKTNEHRLFVGCQRKYQERGSFRRCRDLKKFPQKSRFLKTQFIPFWTRTTVENNLNERRFVSKLVCWTATMYTYMEYISVSYGGTCNNVHTWSLPKFTDFYPNPERSCNT